MGVEGRESRGTDVVGSMDRESESLWEPESSVRLRFNVKILEVDPGSLSGVALGRMKG